MRELNFRELRKRVEADGINSTCQHLIESLQNGELKSSDFSIRQLYASLMVDGNGHPLGTDFLDNVSDRRSNGQHLLEDGYGASNAISSAGLASVNGQIFYNELLAGYNQTGFVLKNMIPERPTTIMDGEKFGGVSELNPVLVKVPEGGEIPKMTVAPNYVQTPATYKVAAGVDITLEEVLNDKTGQVMERARMVGETIGTREEIDAAVCIADLLSPEGTQTHRYNWRSTPGAAQNILATYADNSGSHLFDNLSAGTSLADYTQLEAVELLLQNQVSPFTGLPIEFDGSRKLIVTQTNLIPAQRVVRTIQVRDPVAVASGATRTQITDGNSLWATPEIVMSKWLNYVFTAFSNNEPATTYFYGYPDKAFRKMVFIPLQTEEATVLNPKNWTHDIAFSWKARKQYSYITIEPRAVVKATA